MDCARTRVRDRVVVVAGTGAERLRRGISFCGIRLGEAVVVFHCEFKVSGAEVHVTFCLLIVFGHFDSCTLLLSVRSPSIFHLGVIVISKNKTRLVYLTDLDTL